MSVGKILLSQLMLVGLHKKVVQYLRQHISQVTSNLSHRLLFNHRFSLLSYTLRRILLFTFSYFLQRACVVREEYVSLSNSLRVPKLFSSTTIQDSSQRLYGFCFYCWMFTHPHLFIVHEYWRNFTSYIQIYHPLQIHFVGFWQQRTILRWTINQSLYPSETGR